MKMSKQYVQWCTVLSDGQTFSGITGSDVILPNTEGLRLIDDGVEPDQLPDSAIVQRISISVLLHEYLTTHGRK